MYILLIKEETNIERCLEDKLIIILDLFCDLKNTV